MRASVLLALLAAPGSAQEEAVRPYADPAQLDCPAPKHSHYKQPWRGFLETRSGHEFARGIGVNYNLPGHDELATRLLAEAGIRAVRREVGWGGVKWDESGLGDEARFRRQLALFKQHGLRPTFLLNAHEGVPCPLKYFGKRLAEDAAKGAASIKLADVEGIVAGRTGLNNLSAYWAAESLITAVDAATGECRLSKPLPKDLKKGEVSLATLKYLPLHPAGTKEFDETAEGWVRYAKIVARLATEAGLDDFDLEIWNELSFGTKFLDARNYLPGAPKASTYFLHEGGSCWELARRTVEAVRKDYPKVRFIWGFSNTHFFGCAVDRLPPGMDGQSYHPYGTGLRKLPEQEYMKDKPETNLEGFTPSVEIRMPEGWAHTFVQTESLMRLLNPKDRKRHPPGVERFSHYMTEHGVLPPECGVKEGAEAWDLKSKVALRSYLFWMNKGVDVMHYFCAWEKDPANFGLLPPDLGKVPADVKFDDAATPPLRAIRNLARAFAGSAPVAAPAPLEVDATALGEQRKIFEGDATHPPLWHRDVFAFLPFQADEKRFLIALYVMTYDITKPISEERFRLLIKGLPTPPKAVSLYDPLKDAEVAVKVLRSGPDFLEVEVPATDLPRLLSIKP